MFLQVFSLMWIFYFEKISKFISRSLSPAKTKIEINISVQRQDVCRVVGQRLRSSGDEKIKYMLRLLITSIL